MEDISKILFIGTLPTEVKGEAVYGDVKTGWKTLPCYSVFNLVEKFLSTYKGEYWFVNYGNRGASCVQINHKYDSHTCNVDLTNGLTPDVIELLKNADLIYIDSNTLGYIDYRKKADEWIDMFYPLLSDNGCFVIDDDIEEHFPIRKSYTAFFGSYLGKRIYRGLTERFIPAFEHMCCQLTGTLHEFIKISKRRFPTILFRIKDVEDGDIKTNNPKLTYIIHMKFAWNFTGIDDMPNIGIVNEFVYSLKS